MSETQTQESKTTTEGSAETLTNKDIRYRAQYKQAVQDHEAYKAKVESEKKQLSELATLTAQEKKAIENKIVDMQSRLIDSELKVAATAAGLQDLDFVKLIDKSNLKIDEAGNVTGVKEAVEEFKKQKAFLFQPERRQHSTNNASFPEQRDQPNMRSAHEMNEDEWKSKAALMRAGNFKSLV